MSNGSTENTSGNVDSGSDSSVRLFPVAPGLSFGLVHYRGKVYVRRLEMDMWFEVDKENGELNYLRSSSQSHENNKLVQQKFCEDFLDNLAGASGPRIDTASPAEAAILGGIRND